MSSKSMYIRHWIFRSPKEQKRKQKRKQCFT